MNLYEDPGLPQAVYAAVRQTSHMRPVHLTPVSSPRLERGATVGTRFLNMIEASYHHSDSPIPSTVYFALPTYVGSQVGLRPDNLL